MAKKAVKAISGAAIQAAVANMVSAGAQAAAEFEGPAETAETKVEAAEAKVETTKAAVKKVASKKAAGAAKEKAMSKAKVEKPVAKAKAAKVVKKEASKKGFIQVTPDYREKGKLSFGRWFALMKATAEKNKVKMPKGAAQEAYVAAYKGGKSPKEVLGLA